MASGTPRAPHHPRTGAPGTSKAQPLVEYAWRPGAPSGKGRSAVARRCRSWCRLDQANPVQHES